MNRFFPPFPPSVHTVFNDTRASVCVYRGKKSAFVVKCDVSGFSSFEEQLRMLDDFRHSSVVCGLRKLT